jgi:hypothetical protein
MVGEKRGFRTSDPWSRSNNRCTKLLFRLGLFCVLYGLFVWYSGANGPKSDPRLEVLDLPGEISNSEPRCASGRDGIPAVRYGILAATAFSEGSWVTFHPPPRASINCTLLAICCTRRVITVS